MDRKKELKYLFKETPVEAGVYKIENKENHKIFIGSTRNIKTLNRVKFSLDTGTNYNKKLQKEWTEFGNDVFEFTVLEKLKVNEDNKYYNEKEELEKLESKWLNEYKPYGERGYN